MSGSISQHCYNSTSKGTDSLVILLVMFKELIYYLKLHSWALKIIYRAFQQKRQHLLKRSL